MSGSDFSLLYIQLSFQPGKGRENTVLCGRLSNNVFTKSFLVYIITLACIFKMHSNKMEFIHWNNKHLSIPRRTYAFNKTQNNSRRPGGQPLGFTAIGMGANNDPEKHAPKPGQHHQ